MKGRSLLVAVLVGGLLGITLVIGVLVVVQRARIGEPVLRTRSRGGVLVALVLPDATGSTAARVIVYYPPGTGAGKVVEPLTQVVVPGTSANTLRDAFTFGAGASLARAYGSLAGWANAVLGRGRRRDMAADRGPCCVDHRSPSR